MPALRRELEAVLVVEAAEDRRGRDAAARRQAVAIRLERGRQSLGRIGEAGPEARMRPCLVVVLHPARQDASEMVLRQWNQPVDAFPGDRPWSRSQNALALGARTGLLRTRKPRCRIVSSRLFEKILSRSWTKNR